MCKHKPWLLIAQEDLDSAKHLFLVPFMTTLFHIQQCVEKSLKAYLIYKNMSVIKTHDLVKLIDICSGLDKQFEMLRPIAIMLNPYETGGRYPDDSFKKPSEEEIQNFIKQSEYVCNFVRYQFDQ